MNKENYYKLKYMEERVGRTLEEYALEGTNQTLCAFIHAKACLNTLRLKLGVPVKQERMKESMLTKESILTKKERK